MDKAEESAKQPGRLKQRALVLLEDRKKLPIWPRLAEIGRSLREKDVLLLVGETGSGKSTQIPQTLLKEPWCRSTVVKVPSSSSGGHRRLPVGGCIAVTEPRRVAAISLARRVAAEMGTPLGSSSPASKVGYCVRFDRSTSPSTRIVFLTEGMLLQELLRDPWLRRYSAVVVDEVHERGVNVDLVLGFLRRLQTGDLQGRGGVSLKVVVMSATADVAALHEYFAKTRTASPQDVLVSKEIPAREGKKSRKRKRPDDGHDPRSVAADDETLPPDRIVTEAADSTKGVAVCTVKGRQYPVEVLYLARPVSDLMECALRKVFEVHYSEAMPGDILVFLAGQEEIVTLEKLVQDLATQMPSDVPKVLRSTHMLEPLAMC